ncbi:hypothetical protein CUJ83_10985 [Methanocella sp. CWC-04]|uniref:DUF8091 domain-containing protein n=1 Tax=Methanooceanicella nereidis TaxID=2052831 RepID=A0AAP2RE01_9EURY|nr:hypothetical protein [Methanocella sp. CWC-04]MCD1295523.1 hypothetical protein [Methanocella sp. CWC-04]
MSKISTLNEKPLHEALKRWYAQTGDIFEVSVDGFVIDIVRGDLLVEIQTRNFSAIKRKLEKLLIDHSVRLVYPIPRKKWIIKLADDGNSPVSRRKSPKHGSFEHIFEELIRLPELLKDPNFSIELLLIEEEEVRRYDGVRGWRRRGWVTDERRLLRVVDKLILNSPTDMQAFIPTTLTEPFSVNDLARATDNSRRMAQKMVYCLRIMGCVAPVGKRANAILYARRTTE